MRKRRIRIPRYFKVTPTHKEDRAKAKAQEKVMNWFFHKHQDKIVDDVLKRLFIEGKI